MIGYDSVQLDMLEPDYKARLALHTAPFGSQHDARFLYLDADHQQCLNMLRHMTQYSELVLIAKGESGIGKSTLMDHLVETAAGDWFVVKLPGQLLDAPETLLYKIAEGFEATLSPSDVDLMQEALLERLSILHQRDLLPVLFIDDAHLLSTDCLEALLLLADVESDHRRLLHVVIFAEPSIESHFRAPQLHSLRERLTHTIELPLFNEAESTQYLRHRLAAAGYQGELPMDDKVLKKIYKDSNGLPAELNRLAHEALEGNAVEEAGVVDETQHGRKFPWRIILGGVVIVVLGLVLRFQDEINAVFNETSTATTAPQIIAEQGKETSPFLPPLPDKPVLPETPRTEERVITLQPEAGPVAPAATGNTTTPTSPAPASMSAPQVTSVRPEPVVGSTAPQTIVISGSGFTRQSIVTMNWPGGSKVLSSQQYNVVDDKTIQATLTTGNKASDWSLSVADPEMGVSNTFYFKVTAASGVVTATPTASKPAPVATESMRGHAWIREQPGTHFTLQLLGSYSSASITSYARKHALTGKAASFHSLHEGKDWYVLIYGSYADRAQAEAAVKELPAAAQKSKPWVRRFDDVQAQLLQEKPVTKAAPAAPKPAITNAVQTNTSQDEAWLWSQNPSGFTIQLVSSPNSDQVERLKQRLRLPQKLLIFTTQHEGKTWYTLLYGSFDSQATAKDAIKLLPAELRQGNPWARSFASVHSEMHRTGE